MAQFNSGYSSSEILAMQRDAAERVREMQRRAQQRLQQSNGQPVGQNNPTNTTHSPSPPHNQRQAGETSDMAHSAQRQNASFLNHSAVHSSPTSFNSAIQGILDQFHLDHDRILLILLFLVLMREDADPTLLLALAYIFL